MTTVASAAGTARNVVRASLVARAVLFVAMVAGLAGCAPARESRTPQSEPVPAAVARARADTVSGRYATVNGLRMYYEVHGEATGGVPPLVLLHGGGSTIETTFGRVLPSLAASRQVIAVELQGHGHTADREGPLSFAQDADDVAALLRAIAVPEVDVFGFSNGANTTLELARRHPSLVRRLVVASGFVTRDAIPEPVWESFRQPPDPKRMPPALREAYLKAAPDPSRLPVLVGKLMQRLNSFRDWTDAEVQSIRNPTLLMVADGDVVTMEHAVRMARLLPRAQLLVLPGATHGSYLGEAGAEPCAACVAASVALVARFLDSPGASAK